MYQPSAKIEGPSASPERLRSLFDRIRAQQRRQLWLQGAAAAGAVLCLFCALAGWAGNLGAGPGAGLLAFGVVASLAALGFFGLWRARREVGSDARIARLIGRAVPGVSFELLTAVELADEMRGAPSFSPQLANAFIARASDRAAEIRPEHVVDGRRLRVVVQSAAALVAVVVLAVAFTYGRWSHGIARIFAPAGSSSSVAQIEPITGDVEVAYRYPPYTGLAPRTLTGTDGSLSAPAGTEVLLKTRADREVARADLLVNGKRLPLKVDANRRDLSGSLVLMQSGQYSISFWNGSHEVARGPDVPIKVEPDQPPQVTIDTPGAEIEVEPGQQVALGYSVSDDYGITQVELVFQRQSSSSETRVPLKHDDGRRTRGVHTWDLAELHLSPGERVTYRVEALDNNAIAGKQKGASRTQVLKLYSADEHRREAILRAEQIWEKMIGHLGDRLEGPDRAEEKDADRVASQAGVDRQGLMLTVDLATAAREMSKQKDAPTELWGALANIAHSLSPKVSATGDARRLFLRYHRLDAPEDLASRRLTEAASAEIAELEKDILYLEQLLDRQRMKSLQEMARQLQHDKRELSSLLEKYAQTKDAQLQQEILRRVDALKHHINDLLKRMSELAKNIRDEHFNSEAMKELMKQQNVGDSLDEIQKLVREGKSEEALKELQKLSMQMEKMLGDLEQPEQSLSQRFPGLTEKFLKFRDALQKTREEQQRVADETKKLRDRYREKARQQVMEKAKQMKEQLLKQAEQLAAEYKNVDPNTMGPSADKPLEQTQEMLQSMQQAIKADDFDLAGDAADRAEQSAAELRNNAQEQWGADERWFRPGPMRTESRKLAERLSTDADKVSEIAKKLRQLQPQPGQMMTPDDRAKMKKLAGEQQQVEKRAEDLQRRMQEIQQQAPVFGQRAMQQMNQVGESMAQAQQRLDSSDASRGFNQQKSALEGMADFEKQMKQNQGQGKGGGLPMPMFANGDESEGEGEDGSQKKVDIPEDDLGARPELRKDLLDAMKQGTPEKYREQVKHYYEELVK